MSTGRASWGLVPMGAAAMLAFAVPADANPKTDGRSIPKDWMESLQWRSIGPANMGGRITDLAVYEADPSVWWAATASGGLLKTTNNGITFDHQFDHEATVSIGAVAVAPTDQNIVWVGTGEANPRNSVSWGDGVYKSTDGGETWTNMGLKGSFQIGRIAIHPEDPAIVYVGALGRLWGPNEERGLFKTIDGGETWEKVLYVDEHTGVIDVRMQPGEPDTLLVATWERGRDGFDTNDPATKWGPGSAIYRTTDGGATFEKSIDGLPEGMLGRIGLDWYRADPDVVYAIVESDRIGEAPENAAYMGIRGGNADVGARLSEVTEDGPAAEAGFEAGDIVIRVEEKIVHSYQDLVDQIRRHLDGETVEMEVSRERESVILEVTFGPRPGAEEDPEEDPEEDEEAARKRRLRSSPFTSMLGGQRENVQDQQGPDGHHYGGVFRSADEGRTWERINSVNPRPMYFSEVRVDPSDEEHLAVLGVSLYKSSDGGETFERDGGRGVHPDHHAMWIDPDDGRHIILGNDGGIYVTYDRMEHWDHLNHVAIGQFYHVTVGPKASYSVYGGLQDNGTWGGPGRVRNGSGPINEDWLRIGGGDGFVCRVDEEDPDQIYFESQNGGMGRRNLRTGDRGSVRPRAPRGTRYRFNWKTPFILSHHNSRVHYAAGNHVFRSMNRGRKQKAISPEITNTDRGSATALAESRHDPDVLYVGTDDGALWMTKNGGHDWIDLFDPPAETEADDAPGDGEVETEVAPDEPAEAGAAPAAEGESKAEGETEAEPEADAEVGAESVAEAEGEPEAEPETDVESASEPEAEPEAVPTDDPVTGSWKGKARSERMSADRGDFTLSLRLAADGTVTGRLKSEFAGGAIEPGTFDRAKGRIAFEAHGERFTMSYHVRISGDRMTGSVEMGEFFSMELDATRVSEDVPAEPEEPPAEDPWEWSPIDELLPGPRWVSSIETSRAEEGRVYVTFDGHRSDDDEPYVFVSEDFGRRWRSLRGDLPEGAGPVRVVREDLTDAAILYLGTEFAAWVSVDRGVTWNSLNTNLPTVAIHEIAQHPTCGEIVAATHGRSLWVLDVTPLRQMAKLDVAAGHHLFRPNDVRYWRSMPSRGGSSPRFVGQNPPAGAEIFYCLGDGARVISLRVTDPAGRTIRELEAESGEGMHRVSWNLRRRSVRTGRQRGGPRIAPGTYTVILDVNDEELKQPLTVAGDPEYPDAVLWGAEYDAMMEELGEKPDEANWP